jgi:hypothetical protein
MPVEVIDVDESVLKELDAAMKGAVAAVQILRDDGSFYRKRNYGMSEADWNERIVGCMQTLAVGAIDAVLFKVFLNRIDRMTIEERLAIESLSEQWDLFRADCAMKRFGKKGGSDAEETAVEEQNNGDVHDPQGTEEHPATDSEPPVGAEDRG